MKEYTVKTRSRVELVNITARVREAVRDSGVSDGLCTVFVPHTTAGVTINENADPDVVAEVMNQFAKIAEPGRPYRHMEGNSDAHVKSSLVGPSLTVIVAGGAPVLGTWQGVYFCEFDGPRTRRFVVKAVSG